MIKTIVTKTGSVHIEMTAQEVSNRLGEEKSYAAALDEERMKHKPPTTEQRLAALEESIRSIINQGAK